MRREYKRGDVMGIIRQTVGIDLYEVQIIELTDHLWDYINKPEINVSDRARLYSLEKNVHYHEQKIGDMQQELDEIKLKLMTEIKKIWRYK